MLHPPLVSFLSLFRATGEFVFAVSRRLRLRRRSRPVNVRDVLARDGVGFEGQASGTGSTLSSGATFVSTCGQCGRAPLFRSSPITGSPGGVEARLGAFGLFAI